MVKSLPLLNDKTAYIHTPCRIAIDLRKAKVQALLQSTSSVSYTHLTLPTKRIV